jgi:hypothetical protein
MEEFWLRAITVKEEDFLIYDVLGNMPQKLLTEWVN